MSEYVKLRLVPVTHAEAKSYIRSTHRHNEPPITFRATVGVADEDGKLRGVGILGIPKARGLMDGRTAEVLRVATDGVRNGCSMLYGALVRIAWAMGYDRVITYTLADEPGTSLKASGWRNDGTTDGGAWVHTLNTTAATAPTMFYQPKVPTGPKVRWVIERGGAA